MGASDKGKEIATHLQDEVCRKTMDIFVRVSLPLLHPSSHHLLYTPHAGTLAWQAYGAEAGVAALKWLPYGGLYLTGGLTPKNIELIQDPDGPFLGAFLDKVA
jgi:hypothetical protein